MTGLRLSTDSAVRIAFLLAVAAAWILMARSMPPYLIPPPALVLQDMWLLVAQPGLRRHIWATMFHIVAAIGISVALAFVLVLLSRSIPVLARLIEDRMTPLVNAFPAIGWTLLGILWFGLDASTVIFAITAMLLPFNIINLSQGLRATNEDLLEMAQSFGGNPFRRFALVGFPLLAPFLFATLRLNFGVSWKVALTAELLGGNSGLGYIMNLAMQEQNTARILAISFLIVLFVYIADVKMLAAAQSRFDSRFRTA